MKKEIRRRRKGKKRKCPFDVSIPPQRGGEGAEISAAGRGSLSSEHKEEDEDHDEDGDQHADGTPLSATAGHV